MIEAVTVEVDGNTYRGWTLVAITAGLTIAARDFHVSITEPIADKALPVFKPYAPVKVLAGGDLLLDGYVDYYEPGFTPSSHSVGVGGRSKGGQVIDNFVTYTGGAFVNRTALQIADALNTTATAFETDQDLSPLPGKFQHNPGETILSAVHRAIQPIGLTAMGLPSGGIRLTKAGTERHAGALVMGTDAGTKIDSGTATFDGADRYSKVIVHGTAVDEFGDELRGKGEAIDETVPIDRTKVLVIDQEARSSKCKQRASHEVRRAAGNATRADVTVNRWRDEDGDLWEPNRLIYVRSPFLRLDQDMLIERVRFTQSERSGTLADLTLVDPRTHGGEKPGRTRSDQIWDTPNGE